MDYAFTADRRDKKLFEAFFTAFKANATTEDEKLNSEKYRQWVQVLEDRCVEKETAASGGGGKKKKVST